MESWKDPTTPFLWLISGSALLLVLIGFILLSLRIYIRRIKQKEEERRKLMAKHQQALLNNTIQSQEQEKNRISATLHDNILGQLHRIKLINNDKTITPILNSSIAQIRQISHELMPLFIAQLHFDEIIGESLHPLEKSFEITFYSNADHTTLLSTAKKLQLFRIFQELITNCIKHSCATSVAIDWKKTKTYYCLIVKDNGIGMPSEVKKGLGIKNIEMRINLIGGKMKMRSAPHKGTQFTLFNNIT